MCDVGLDVVEKYKDFKNHNAEYVIDKCETREINTYDL